MAQADNDKKLAKKTNDKKVRTEANIVSRYIRETRGELRKVVWPTPTESFRLTAIVIGVTLFMCLFLFGFDFVFSSLVELLVQQVT